MMNRFRTLTAGNDINSRAADRAVEGSTVWIYGVIETLEGKMAGRDPPKLGQFASPGPRVQTARSPGALGALRPPECVAAAFAGW
jgi:hypothetical protein